MEKFRGLLKEKNPEQYGLLPLPISPGEALDIVAEYLLGDEDCSSIAVPMHAWQVNSIFGE